MYAVKDDGSITKYSIAVTAHLWRMAGQLWERSLINLQPKLQAQCTTKGAFMKSIFEEMGGTYRQEGDYLLPNLSLPTDAEEFQIGKYGRMRTRYLKEHRPVLFTNLLLSGRLDQHLAEIDQACIERLEHIAADMAKAEGVTEALKASDQMKWVGCMNNIHNRAEEMVLSVLIYN